jgi:Cys-rich protein (TIGR01571 family)
MPHDWHSAICACCCSQGCGLCCIAAFAPCFVFGENYRLLKEYDKTHKSSFIDSLSCLKTCDDKTKATWLYGIPWILGVVGEAVATTSSGWIGSPLAAISCIAFLLQCQIRGDIRNVSKLPEDCCCDCCASYFCYACALEQERRQLEHLKHIHHNHTELKVPLTCHQMDLN